MKIKIILPCFILALIMSGVVLAGCSYDGEISLQKARFDFVMATEQGRNYFQQYYGFDYTPKIKMLNDFNFALRYAKC